MACPSPSSTSTPRFPTGMATAGVAAYRPGCLTLNRVRPAVDDVASPGVLCHGAGLPRIDSPDGNLQPLEGVGVLVRHRIIAGDENPIRRLAQFSH